MGLFFKSFICPACNFGKAKLLFDFQSRGDTFFLYRCEQCALVSTFPIPETESLYPVYYTGYRSHRNGQRFFLILDRLMKLWRYIRAFRIVPLSRGGKLIDVGCGQAVDLQILKRLGVAVAGIEYSDTYAKAVSKDIGIDIYSGKVRDLDLPAGTLRMITFLHSLEHIPDMNGTLAGCKRLLGDGGYLMISVPDINSLESRFFGKAWFHLDIPRHLYHFSEDFLKKHLLSFGFTLVNRKRIAPEYDYFSLLQSALNMLFPSQYNLLYRILLREEKKNFNDYMLFVRQLPFVVVLGLIGLPATFFLWFFGGSGTMELVFQKTG